LEACPGSHKDLFMKLSGLKAGVSIRLLAESSETENPELESSGFSAKEDKTALRLTKFGGEIGIRLSASQSSAPSQPIFCRA